MKLLTSISMSFIFLLQGMALDMDLCEQIEKVSHFINHYQDHKNFDGDSFFEYVVDEYFSDDHGGKEHHKNSNQGQSPAHSNHQCCHPLVFIAPSNLVTLSPLKIKENVQISTYTNEFNSRFLESLFQPPRA